MMENEDQNIEVKNTVARVQTHREYSTVSYYSNRYIFNKYNTSDTFSVKDMYFKEITSSIVNYYVKGVIGDNGKTAYYFGLILDYETSTYKIQELTSNEYQELITSNSKLVLDEVKSYEFTAIDPTEREISVILFNDYRQKLLYDTKAAYNILDKEIKEKKYKEYDTFYKEMQSKYNEIGEATLRNYKVEREVEYTKYTLKDQNGNTMYLYETLPMQYTIKEN